MKTSKTDNNASIHGDEDDDDDQKEFNGMDVEDWLVKQHELAERTRQAATDGRHTDALKSAAGADIQRNKENTPPKVNDSENSMVDHGSVSSEPSHLHSKIMASNNNMMSGVHEDQMDEEQAAREEQVLEAYIRHVDITDDFYTAELTGTSRNDGLLLVDGVRTIHLKVMRMLQLFCALAVATLLAVVAGMITTHLVQEPALPADTTIGIPSSSSNDSIAKKPVTSIPLPPALMNAAGNLSMTLSEAILTAESKGMFPTGMFMSPSIREVVVDKFNRTDVNYTCFLVVKSNIIQVINGLDISLMSKIIGDPWWTGHMLDLMESLFVEGMFFDFEDMYEGMVLTSLSGYPIKIQVNPLRANNVSFEAKGLLTQFYKNGVVHSLFKFPDPFIPWKGKSLFDVLVETNEKRQDDLSVIIDLIQNSSDDIKNLFVLRAGDTSATTFFAPTNAAMATINLPVIGIDETTLLTFLEDHLVSGNFARRFWQHMPISAETSSDSGFAMTTLAGQVLDVKIDDTTVTINGNVTIVQGDIFCEQGIMHVIDSPLPLFLSWDVFGGRL